jgi:hypothetical protein
MVKEQKLPSWFDEKPLKKYAMTFFGFGSWKADYWLVGLEERGATKDEFEFCKRYHAWKKMQDNGMVNDGLVDLGKFFEKCDIKNPKTPNWTNQTWQAIHCICREAGLCIDELCACNARWGGADAKKGSCHVALIESMPFPAPSTREQDWPYAKWNLDCMKSREQCASKFLDARLKILTKMFETHKPKMVITYGRDYTHRHNIRDWIAKIRENQASSWEQGAVKGKRKFSHFCLKQICWTENSKSLLVCIAQPASFRGACIPFRLGEIIQKKLATKSTVSFL